MRIIEAAFTRLGTVKNQLLVFCIIGAVIIFSFAKPLTASSVEHINREGIRMYFAGIGLLFFGAGFYTFALFNLPSSMQEIVFERQAQATIARHRKTTAKVRRRNV